MTPRKSIQAGRPSGNWLMGLMGGPHTLIKYASLHMQQVSEAG